MKISKYLEFLLLSLQINLHTAIKQIAGWRHKTSVPVKARPSYGRLIHSQTAPLVPIYNPRQTDLKSNEGPLPARETRRHGLITF